MKSFYWSFTSYILKDLRSLWSGEVIGDSVEKLAGILTTFAGEQPLLYEKAFIPLDSILELCTILQVSEKHIRGLHYLSAENAIEIISSIAFLFEKRIIRFWDDDNTDYEKGIGAWHSFYDSNSIAHWYVDDSTYEIFEAGVLEIFQKYLEYSPKRDFPIIRIWFWVEILQIFSWWLLAYGRECNIYLFLRELILDHREYRILHKYWK